MLRALTTQLIREGRVTTTKARAKALRDEAERMITLAKDGSLAPGEGHFKFGVSAGKPRADLDHLSGIDQARRNANQAEDRPAPG